MNKRIFGMAPGGRMALDRAANLRRYVQYFAMTRKADGAKGRNGRPRERKGAEDNG